MLRVLGLAHRSRATDAAQRSVLFLDVLRQRGNNYREHVAKTAPHVLHYEVEVLTDGRRLDRPVNYALVRVVAPKGLKIVAVSIDDPGMEPAIRAFAKQYGLTFEILHDPKGAIRDAYDISGYPETFIIGRDGLIRRKLMSATDWNSPDARALVGRLLTERTE